MEIIEVTLDNNRPECFVRIRNALTPPIKDAIMSLLRQYQDVFVFELLEMPRIAPEVMQHRLNVDASHKLVIHMRQHLGAQRSEAAAMEV